MKYRAEGGSELASAAQQKSARFHGLPDSEIYTTEYVTSWVREGSRRGANGSESGSEDAFPSDLT